MALDSVKSLRLGLTDLHNTVLLLYFRQYMAQTCKKQTTDRQSDWDAKDAYKQ